MANFHIAPRKAVAHNGHLFYAGDEEKLVQAMGKAPDEALLKELRRKKVVLTEAQAAAAQPDAKAPPVRRSGPA